MTSGWQAEKRAIVEAAHRMAEHALLPGASGNISVRLEPDRGREILAITGSGKQSAALAEEDVVVVDFNVEPVEGDLAPSSETLMHVAIYRARGDVGAVIHSHSPYASVAAVAGREIPPIVDEMVIAIGGAVRVSEYAFPGTQKLADSVCSTLGERNAALIGNHGGVCVGRDLDEAMEVCAITERMAKIFFQASLLGGVNVLPPEAVEAERSIFRMRRQREFPAT